MSENDVTELSNKTHKTIQILSGLTVVVLGGLLYFGIFGAGIPLYLAFGFVNIFLTICFTDIFIQEKGLYERLECVKAEALLVSLLVGLLIIGFAEVGYIASGVVLSFGIQLFLMGVFGFLRFLNEYVFKPKKKFLKLFYKTENTTSAISILNCLALGVMVLRGYCNLACAISLGAPLLGVSLILKLGMFLYDRYRNGKQQTKIVLTDNNNENKNPDSNLDLNNNKDNHFPPQGDDNKENKETELKNQEEQTLGENK